MQCEMESKSVMSGAVSRNFDPAAEETPLAEVATFGGPREASGVLGGHGVSHSSGIGRAGAA